jgi:copper chaperone CopZ
MHLRSIFLLLTLGASAPALTLTACESAPVVEQIVILEVKGMVCDSCEQAITHELNKLDGVLASTVDHERERAEVRINASLVTPDAVRAAIASLGYQARVIES